MKFKIVMCDNDQEDLSKSLMVVDRFLENHSELIRDVVSYTDPEKLLKECNPETVDVFLLDVIMPEINGIDVGRAIRKKNRNVSIIFTTASREYAFDAFKIRALGYLEKPVVYRALEELLLDAIAKQKGIRKNKVIINTKSGIRAVNSNDILYVENENRTAVYYLINGERIISICNRKSFEVSVIDAVSYSNFIHPHKSFFVNMEYVKKIHQSTIVLDSDMEIPISKRHLSETKQAYIKFASEDGD